MRDALRARQTPPVLLAVILAAVAPAMLVRLALVAVLAYGLFHLLAGD